MLQRSPLPLNLIIRAYITLVLIFIPVMILLDNWITSLCRIYQLSCRTLHFFSSIFYLSKSIFASSFLPSVPDESSVFSGGASRNASRYSVYLGVSNSYCTICTKKIKQTMSPASEEYRQLGNQISKEPKAPGPCFVFVLWSCHSERSFRHLCSYLSG